MKRQRKGVWKSTKKKRERLKCAYIKVGKRFKNSLELSGQDVNGDRKLFWKEVGNSNEGKLENCNR